MLDPPTREQIDWASKFTSVNIGAFSPAGPAAPLAFGPTPGAQGVPGTSTGAPATPVSNMPIPGGGNVTLEAERGSSWTADNKQSASQAINAVDPADRDALKDIEIDRVQAIDGDPNTLGVYEPVTDLATGAQTKKILLADGLFSDGTGKPPVPAQEQTRRIVHELAHVIARKASNDADKADGAAQNEVTKKIAAKDAAVKAFDDFKKTRGKDPIDELYGTPRPSGARRAQLKKDVEKWNADEEPYSQAQQAAWADVDAARAAKAVTEAAVARTKVPPAVVAAGQQQTDAAEAAADAASTSAGRGSAHEDPRTTAYRKAVADVTAKLKDYSSNIKQNKVGQLSSQTHPGDWEKDIEKLFKLRNDAQTELIKNVHASQALTDLVDVTRTQDELRKKLETQARLPNRSPQMQAFVDVVEQNHIDPKTISRYAENSWPSRPEEVFAEVYSFWRTSPASVNPKLVEWFDKGLYR